MADLERSSEHLPRGGHPASVPAPTGQPLRWTPARWTATRFTARVGVRYPLVQGAMGGGHSTPALVAAASNAGALGSLGAYHLAPTQIAEQVAAIRARTPHPFAVNLWVPHPGETAGDADALDLAPALALLQPYRDELGLPPLGRPPVVPAQAFAAQVEAVLDAGAPVLSVVFGVPPADVVEAAHRRGVLVIGTATTVDEAEALEAGGVDLVVASGFEAGGHRGSFLRPAEASLTGTLALVPQVRDAVRVPVVAAGGIADGRGVAAALVLGADAAQVGTAFLAADEAGAGALHRAALTDPGRARRTTLTRAFSGRLARVLENRATRELGAQAGRLAPWPVQGALVRDVRQAAEAAGRDDFSALFAGQGAPLARRRAAVDVVRTLVEGAAAAFGQSATSGSLNRPDS
jgi:nitronate monooxygenase